MAELDQQGKSVVYPRPAALRAARVCLGWSLIEASGRARMSVATLFAAERSEDRKIPTELIQRLRDVYEHAGIMTFDEDTFGY